MEHRHIIRSKDLEKEKSTTIISADGLRKRVWRSKPGNMSKERARNRSADRERRAKESSEERAVRLHKLRQRRLEKKMIEGDKSLPGFIPPYKYIEKMEAAGKGPVWRLSQQAQFYHFHTHSIVKVVHVHTHTLHSNSRGSVMQGSLYTTDPKTNQLVHLSDASVLEQIRASSGSGEQRPRQT